MLTNEVIYRTTKPATDEDWASPEFDYLQSCIADLLDPTKRYVTDGKPNWRERMAQQWRDARPYLIANIRNNLGDPKWDPRGARVISLKRAEVTS